MKHEQHHDPQPVTRRGLLSLAAVVTGGVALSPWSSPLGPPDPNSNQAAPTNAPSPSTTPKTLRNRDPLLTVPLTKTSKTSGAIRHFEAAFPALNTKSVIPLPGLNKASNPWLAVSIVGPAKQLQIIDPDAHAPAHVLSILDSHNGGIESMIWHRKTKTLYFSTGNRLLSWNNTQPKVVQELGQVPKATTLYELQLDEAGNVWGGTYPNGATFTYSVATKKFSAHSRLAADTDYVRRLAIGPDDTVWAGTGSLNPRLFTFPAARPEQRTEIQLPDPMANGFISSITAFGGRILVATSNISGYLILDPSTKKWTGTSERVWASHVASSQAKDGGRIYSITKGNLYATNTSTWQDTLLGALETSEPLSIQADSKQVLVVSEIPTGLQLEYFNLASGAVETTRTVALKSGEYKIQSLMGHSDGNIYVGGYMGNGLAAVNPDTGARWHSPDNEQLINQVEAMIEFDVERTYIGSYGSADIISVENRKKDIEKGYKRLERLSREYHQSRPFGWAVNARNVFFGTVPDYGRAGGVLGMIDPHANEIAWVLDGGGEGFVKAHSIIGLAADEKYVYGTSSVRNGYGIPDTKGAAKLFKLEIATKKKTWETTPVADAGALYSPKLIAGWLVVADVEGINIINPATGELVKRHRLTQANNAASRPGWANADLAQVGDGSKVVHSAAGTTTVVDFRAGTKALIGSPTGKERFGSRLTSTPSGRVFGYTNKTVLVELDLVPAKKPAKPTKSAQERSPARQS